MNSKVERQKISIGGWTVELEVNEFDRGLWVRASNQEKIVASAMGCSKSQARKSVRRVK